MEKGINKKKIIIFAVIIFIIILIVVFNILYRENENFKYYIDENIFKKDISENSLPYIYNNSSNIYAFNNTIIVLEENVLRFYNKSANEIGTLDINISSPIFKSAGRYLCVAEQSGSKFYLIRDKNILWQNNIEGSISNICVNSNGYVAVSISDTTYKTICKLYDNKGSELFTTYLSTSYIIDFCISEDNKYFALAEVNTSGITVQSNIKIISINDAISNSANPIQYNYTSNTDNLITNINFCSDNSLLCIYDNHIDAIKDNSVKEITNLETTNILFADINNKLVQIEKKSTNIFSSEYELQIINASNLNKKTYTFDKEPKAINVFDNAIAINFGTEALFINNSGLLINHYSSSQEIKSIIISNDLAGIVFKDKIEFLSI